MRLRGSSRVALLSIALFATAGQPLRDGEQEPRTVDEFLSYTAVLASPLKQMPEREAWRRVAPKVEDVHIPSSSDGSAQSALFFAPEDPEPRPLLVVLHSWSVDYLDPTSVPYALWAERNGWVFIHPDYRGRFDNPEATGSELAVRDILDAVEYARSHAHVDPTRIYIAGYSGGAMMALNMAGRFPELWAGVVAWVPVFDLVQWHSETRHKYPRYAREIRRSCSGEPLPGSAAEQECLRRSPRTYLERARDANVPIYIATGINDPFVSPSHSIAAFNLLAHEDDRFSEEQLERIAHERLVPSQLDGVSADPVYEAAGKPLLLRRASGPVTLQIFRGRHDVIYNAGLLWLAEQRRSPGSEQSRAGAVSRPDANVPHVFRRGRRHLPLPGRRRSGADAAGSRKRP
jgi:acetyl esterase/lipase